MAADQSVREMNRHVPDGSDPRRSSVVAVAIVAVPGVVLAIGALARWRAGSSGIDLAILDQGLWLASHGHGLFSSVLHEHLLGDHFAPAVLLFVPLYRLAPTAAWLLVGQVVAATAASALIAGRLKAMLDSTRRAALAAALLISPPVTFALMADVHGIVFAGPFALGAVFAAQDRRPRRAAALGLIAAMFRQEAGAAVVVALVLLMLDRHLRRACTLPLILICAYLPVATLLESRLGAGDSHWTGHFERLGSSPADALAHPWRFATVLLSVTALSKTIPWLLTCGFLCFRRPRCMLPAAVAALPVIASSWPGTASWVFHYGYLPTVLLALAWLPAVADRPDAWRRVAGSCLALNLLASPLVPSLSATAAGTSFGRPVWTRPPDADLLAVTQGLVGDDVVAGDSWALALVAHRPGLFLWPFPFAPAGKEPLPNPQLQQALPVLAASVDVIIVPRIQAAAVPPGFMVERSTPTYVRYRRGRGQPVQHGPPSTGSPLTPGLR